MNPPGRQYLIFPSWAQEFQREDKLLLSWEEIGIDVRISIALRELEDSTENYFFPGKHGGGVLSILETESTLNASCVRGDAHSIHTLRGMELGNRDALVLRESFWIVQPNDLVGCRLTNGRRTNKDLATYTIENDEISKACELLLLLPAAKSGRHFTEAVNDELAVFGCYGKPVDLHIQDIVRDPSALFSNPSRRMEVLELVSSHKPSEYLLAAIVAFVVNSVSAKCVDLESAVFFSDFSPLSPSFRRHWTSNR